jgi:recombination protein RecT
MSDQLQKAHDVRKLLNSDVVREQIAKALPSICNPERFMRVAMTAITKTPKIADCTQESLMTCLLDCAQLGIEPDGRRAHLIPYKTKCTLIIDYKGLVELVRRSGEVVKLHADVVCENDVFEANMGNIICHKIDYKKERGAPYAYYALAQMKDGSMQSEIMTPDEVGKIRARSKAAQSGPWVTDYTEMCKKTVFRRLSKWLPMQTDVAVKLQEVEKLEFDFEMPKEPKEVKSNILEDNIQFTGEEND